MVDLHDKAHSQPVEKDLLDGKLGGDGLNHHRGDQEARKEPFPQEHDPEEDPKKGRSEAPRSFSALLHGLDGVEENLFVRRHLSRQRKVSQLELASCVCVCVASSASWMIGSETRRETKMIGARVPIEALVFDCWM